MAKVSKKVERLARGLCLASQIESKLGSGIILMRVETRWPLYLEEAEILNSCLNLIKDDLLDGDTEWVLTEEEYNEPD